MISDPDHRSTDEKKKSGGILEPIVLDRSRRKPSSAQLVGEIVITDRIDMAGRVNRVGARQEQRIEKSGETGMKIPPARIEIEDVWRADDRQPSRPQNAMESPSPNCDPPPVTSEARVGTPTHSAKLGA